MAHVFRFFLPVAPDDLAVGSAVQLAPDDAKRLHKVLRLEVGEVVEIADGQGRVFLADVTNARGGEVVLTTELSAPQPLVQLRVLLAQSGPRADDAVEKLVELGVAEIGPLLAAGRRREARTDRWERIAAGAAAQAKLSRIPMILQPVAYSDALAIGAIVCSHEEYDTLFADALDSATHPITLLIGPEPGFSSDELTQARVAGCPIATLGGTVLRTETAAIVAAALVRALLGA